MIMQRQVPARPSVRQPGTRDENAASEDPFAKVLSGQQKNQDGGKAIGRGEAAPGSAETTAAGHDADGEGASGSGSDEMMALLDGLMSSAAYPRDAGPADPDAAVEEVDPDTDGAVQAEEAELEIPVEADAGLPGALEDPGMIDDAETGKPENMGAGGDEPVPDTGTQPLNQAAKDSPAAMVAAASSQPATAAAAASRSMAAKPAAPAKGLSEEKTAAATPGLPKSAERADATTSETKQALRNMGAATEPVPAGTEPGKATRNERSNAFSEARASLGATRNEERLEGKARNVEVLESRRFLGAQPVSANAQMLARSLGDASGEIFQAQRSAPAQSAALPGQPQSGQMLHTLKLQLNPASLGSVTAVLKLTGEELTVDIKVHTAEAYRQLSDDNQAILKSLRAQGYGVEQINIQHVAGGPDRSAGQTLQQGQQNAFQGPGSGDAQASGREAGGQGGGRQTGKQQGNQGHEQNSYASSDTQRSDGVYL